MAEISSPENSGKKTAKRKIRSLKVDLTPMVDLGFILITFFIFTTSMSEPKSMKVKFPDDRIPDSSKTLDKKTLNIILRGNDRIGYYFGNDVKAMKIVRTDAEIRRVVQAKRISVAEIFGDPREMVVLIKPSDEANYQDVVDMLDEMTINGVTRHVLMEPEQEELEFVVP